MLMERGDVFEGYTVQLIWRVRGVNKK